MRELKHLAFAVGYRKIGIVALQYGKLHNWQIAKAAYSNTSKLEALVNSLIDAHDPSVVVVERTDGKCRKGDETQCRIVAISEIAKARKRLVREVAREHDFENKYEEAKALVETYPELKSLVPKKVPCWKHEPRLMIMFEALAMADQVMHEPAEKLAAAMG